MEFEKIIRESVPSLDEILGKKFNVLDDGFIRVVDYMGTDNSIVQAARVSYGKGTKTISEDKGLIRYLMRHSHTTPFEMCEIKLHVRVPMDCWRQWIRHRTASVNEYSTRYSLAIDSSHKTSSNEWRTQSQINKQGSGNFLDEEIGTYLSKRENELHEIIKSVYDERINMGVAREQARKDLPLSTYTEAYWKINLHNLLNFLSLRMDAHAQYEIRSYANIIGNEIVSKWCPIAWDAFTDYRLNSLKLSNIEITLLSILNTNNGLSLKSYLISIKWIVNNTLSISRERDEFERKLDTLGLSEKWSNMLSLFSSP